MDPFCHHYIKSSRVYVSPLHLLRHWQDIWTQRSPGCHSTRLVMHQSEDIKWICADSLREARPLKEIYIWRENCCALCCTNVSEGKSSSDLRRELPEARLLMEVNKACEASCYWGSHTENGLQLENSITHRICTPNHRHFFQLRSLNYCCHNCVIKHVQHMYQNKVSN